MNISDNMENNSNCQEPCTGKSPEIPRGIENAAVARLERYNMNPSEFKNLPCLLVDRPITLDAKDRRLPGAENIRPMDIKDKEYLKKVLGNSYEVCSNMEIPKQYMEEAAVLIAAIKKSPEREIAKLGRLAEIYLFLDDGRLQAEVLPLIEGWRDLIRVHFWPWCEIVVNARQTLTVASNVHVLWANRVVLHPGARIVSKGTLKIDAYKMEVY